MVEEDITSLFGTIYDLPNTELQQTFDRAAILLSQNHTAVKLS